MTESTYNHIPKAVDGNLAQAEDVNKPLRELDYAIGKQNFEATTDPTTPGGPGSGQGYRSGRSLWYNTTNGKLWLCTNAGSGTWSQVAVGSTIGSHTHSAADIISGLLSLLVGGTGADLSATGPGVAVQDSAGAVLAVRALAAADLPAASTTAQGAAELTTNAEAQAGTDAARALTAAAAAAAYYLRSVFVQASAGVGDAGKPILLDGEGKVDASMVKSTDIDHSQLANLLSGDPHTQYLLKSILVQKGDILIRDANNPTRLPVGGQDQVLAVDLNESTGFKYVAQITSGSGIPVSTLDAKGDLLAGSADNTVTRLAVGADGNLLMADSAAPAGVKWGEAGLKLIASNATGDFTGLTDFFASYSKAIVNIHNDKGTGPAEEVHFTINNRLGSGHYSFFAEELINGTLTRYAPGSHPAYPSTIDGPRIIYHALGSSLALDDQFCQLTLEQNPSERVAFKSEYWSDFYTYTLIKTYGWCQFVEAIDRITIASGDGFGGDAKFYLWGLPIT